jgi:hypothetical protein
MLRRVDLVKTDISEKRVASIFWVKRFYELGTALGVTIIIFSLKMDATRFSVMSALTNLARRHIPDEGILHSHRCEHLKSRRTVCEEYYFGGV